MSANNKHPEHEKNLRTNTTLVLALVMLAASLLFLALGSASADSGTTWYVDDDANDGGIGTEDHPFDSITDSLAVAQDNDTIRVYQGTYNEWFQVNTSVRLIGNGSLTTIISGKGYQGTIVDVRAPGVEISGFTFTELEENSMPTYALLVNNDGCTISENRFLENDHDIRLNCNRSLVRNNTIFGKVFGGVGISVEHNGGHGPTLINNTIRNNIVHNKTYGIYIEHCHENFITENVVRDSFQGIIIFGFSFDNIAQNNVCINNTFGIVVVDGAYRTRVLNNSLDNLLIDISVTNCHESIFSANSMNGRGFSLSGEELDEVRTHTIDQTNTLDGSPILYLRDEIDIDVTGEFAQVILANCSGGIVHDIEFDEVASGVMVNFCSNIGIGSCSFTMEKYHEESLVYIQESLSITVFDSTFLGSKYGIRFRSSPNGMVTNCTFRDHEWYGIYASASPDLYVSGSTFESCDMGIGLSSSEVSVLRSNTFVQNTRAILIKDSDDAWIEKNTFDRNEFGIVLERGSTGVQAHNNSIANNTNLGIDCSDNQDTPIDARYNDWGDESGPYHPTKNPEGKGDEVTDFVEFDPWKGKEGSGNESDRPDLVVNSITFESTKPFEGDLVLITVNVSNIGNTTVEEAYLRIQSSYNSQNQQFVGTILMVPLQAGNSTSVQVFWNTTQYFGDFTITAHADFDDDISEISEINNVQQHSINIKPASFRYSVDLQLVPDYDNPYEDDEEDDEGYYFYLNNTGTVFDIPFVTITHDPVPGWDIQIYNGWFFNRTAFNSSVWYYPNMDAGVSRIFLLKIEQETILNESSFSGPITITITVESRYYSNVNDSIVIHLVLSPTKTNPDDSSLLPDLPPPPVAGAAIGMISAVSLVAALGLHEPSRFKFFLMLLPLYTRLKKEDLETLENRKEILGFIKGRPGTNYTTIMRELGIGNGTLTYHLKVLEDNRVIKSREDANRKLFYPRDHRIVEKRELILDLLQTSPGLAQKDIVRILRMSRRKANRKLGELVALGKVRIEKVGRENHYFLVGMTPGGEGSGDSAPRSITEPDT